MDLCLISCMTTVVLQNKCKSGEIRVNSHIGSAVENFCCKSTNNLQENLHHTLCILVRSCCWRFFLMQKKKSAVLNPQVICSNVCNSFYNLPIFAANFDSLTEVNGENVQKKKKKTVTAHRSR